MRSGTFILALLLAGCLSTDDTPPLWGQLDPAPEASPHQDVCDELFGDIEYVKDC
ncbi:MAG: hypothetical protein AAF478_13695 [Pseudomonadota bacterium]